MECNRGRISIAINFLRNNVFPVGLGKSERPLGNFETDKFGAGVSYGNRIFSSAKMSCGGNISLLFTHLPRETIFLSLGTHGEEKRRIEHAERAAGKVLAPDVFSPREIPPLTLSVSVSNSRAYRSNRSKKPCGSSRLRLNDQGPMAFSSSFIIHVPFLLYLFPILFPSMLPPPPSPQVFDDRA